MSEPQKPRTLRREIQRLLLQDTGQEIQSWRIDRWMELFRAVRRAERERCVMANCQRCREGIPIMPLTNGTQHVGGLRCNSFGITGLPDDASEEA